MKATKFIQCTISGVSVASQVTLNGTAGVAKQWNATLAVATQAHSDSSTRLPFFYDGNDVAVGDYIASSGDGKFLKVVSISSKNANQVVCVLEDEDSVNALTDETGNLDGLIPNGPSNKAYIFEVRNGAPILANIPMALPGNFAATFASNIFARFNAKFGGPNTINKTALSVGDLTASNIDIIAANNATNKPRLRYKNSTAKWQFSNDGTTFTDIVVYVHPTTDGNLHVPAVGTTNSTKVLKAGAAAGSMSWDFVSWAEIASKPTTVAGFGITDAYTKTEVQNLLKTNPNFYSFTVNFTGSNPTSVTNLPAGWTSAINGTDVTITHNIGSPLCAIHYWGHSDSGGVENYRLPSSSIPATIPSATATSQFTFRITTSVAGADIDSYARVVVGF